MSSRLRTSCRLTAAAAFMSSCTPRSATSSPTGFAVSPVHAVTAQLIETTASSCRALFIQASSHQLTFAHCIRAANLQPVLHRWHLVRALGKPEALGHSLVLPLGW